MVSDGRAADRRLSPWPKAALRISFGLLWAVDAALKWLPGFRDGYLDALREGSRGQPAWLKPWFDAWIDLQKDRVTFFALLVAVVETLIALALLTGFARKITYSLGLVFSFLVWSTAEGFGGPYTSGSTDVGASIVYVLVFAALLLFSYFQGPSRLSVDHWIEPRVVWWDRLAEIQPRRFRD